MPMKKKKHAKHMTTEEAVKHLFHPHVVNHLKAHAEKEEKPRKPKKRSA
jgi:hypothetical protein